jgi:hypothetical protein
VQEPTLEPGDDAPFVVRFDEVPGVARYRVGFRQSGSRAIAHLDRRSQFPGTMPSEPATDLAQPAGARPSMETPTR